MFWYRPLCARGKAGPSSQALVAVNSMWQFFNILLSQVALTAFYNTETQGFATTFFNKTITIVEQPRLIDLELIFLWLLMLSLMGGGGESYVHLFKSFSVAMAKSVVKAGRPQ